MPNIRHRLFYVVDTTEGRTLAAWQGFMRRGGFKKRLFLRFETNQREDTMTKFHAQPYDLSATGFYFETADEYHDKAAKAVNDYGDPVEEFEIQLIDAELIDCELIKAMGVFQSNLEDVFGAIDDWDEQQKQYYIIAVGECGYAHD